MLSPRLSLPLLVALAACTSGEPADSGDTQEDTDTTTAPGVVSAVIGEAGGKLENDTTFIEVPEGALSSDETLSISPGVEVDDETGSTPEQVFEPHGITFNKPVKVGFNTQGEPGVVMWSEDGVAFTPLPTTMDGDFATAEVNGFSWGYTLGLPCVQCRLEMTPGDCLRPSPFSEYESTIGNCDNAPIITFTPDAEDRTKFEVSVVDDGVKLCLNTAVEIEGSDDYPGGLDTSYWDDSDWTDSDYWTDSGSWNDSGGTGGTAWGVFTEQCSPQLTNRWRLQRQGTTRFQLYSEQDDACLSWSNGGEVTLAECQTDEALTSALVDDWRFLPADDPSTDPEPEPEPDPVSTVPGHTPPGEVKADVWTLNTNDNDVIEVSVDTASGSDVEVWILENGTPMFTVPTSKTCTGGGDARRAAGACRSA